MRKRAAAVAAAVLASIFVSVQGAVAACHAFSLSVSPATVEEGGSVTVTVERDGAVADSAVRVSTIDGSAQAGSDYTALNRLAAFTGSSTQLTFSIPIADDPAAEPAENFRVHLSDPAGCDVNPNFSLDGDKTVTIAASDQQAATTTAAPAPPPTTRPVTTTRRATTTAQPAATTTEPATAAEVTTTTLAPTTTTAPEEEEPGGGFPGWLVILLVLALLGGAAGLVAYRRRAG